MKLSNTQNDSNTASELNCHGYVKNRYHPFRFNQIASPFVYY